MINKVQNQVYTYQQTSRNKKLTGSADKSFESYSPQQFGLGNEEQTAEPDTAVERLLEQEEKHSSGVALELTNYKAENTQNAKNANGKMDVTMDGQADKPSFLQRLSTLWTEIKQAFLHFLGEDVERIRPEDITVEDTPDSEPVLAEMQQTEESSEEKVFRKENPGSFLNRTNPQSQELYEALYENGTKKLAKNSTLLTSYDKRGVIVQRDADVEKQILHLHPHTIDESF